MKNQLIISFFLSSLLIGSAQNQVAIPFHENPGQLFNYGLSHGIGESLLDSPLLNDSLNALLLIACRKGLSDLDLKDLFADQKDLDHRLNVLIQAGLLDRNQEQYFCSFPILLNEDFTMYTELITETADKIYPGLKSHLDELLTVIKQRQWEPWSYHIIWSLIFDSQFIWYEMTARNLVPLLTTPAEWVIYPPHKYKTGTNYYPDTELKDYWVVVSWSPEGNNTLGLLGGRWHPIYRLALYGTDSLSGQEIELFTNMNLINSEKEVSFPVIHLKDTFYVDLRNISTTYLNLIQSALNVEKFQQVISSDRKLCWAIAYHDISWEILGRLDHEGLIQRPPPLREVRPASEDDVVGVCSVIAVYQPFINQILKAFEN